MIEIHRERERGGGGKEKREREKERQSQRERETERVREGQTDIKKQKDRGRTIETAIEICEYSVFLNSLIYWFVGFRSSSFETRLSREYAPGVTSENFTCCHRGTARAHILQEPTQPAGSGSAKRESNARPPEQALLAKLLLPRLSSNLIEQKQKGHDPGLLTNTLRTTPILVSEQLF